MFDFEITFDSIKFELLTTFERNQNEQTNITLDKSHILVFSVCWHGIRHVYMCEQLEDR